MVKQKVKINSSTLIETCFLFCSNNMQKFQTSRMLPVQFPREPEPRAHRLRRALGLQATGPDVEPKPHTHRLRARPTLPRD